MPNELTRVIDAIKADPHGETARNVCHWLAVEVMEGQRLYKAMETWPYEHAEYYRFSKASEIIDVLKWLWNPLTDANHTRMLVQKVGVYQSHGGLTIIHDKLVVDMYMQGCLEDACQVLRKCHAEGTLTDETLEGFLNDR